MKDSLSAHFRDRFQGHEASVDPGAWQSIQTQLGTGTASDGLSDLLKKRFAEHEVTVDPAVWQSVSGQLGHAAGGFSIGGWIAAGLGGAVVVGGLLFALTGDGNTADPGQHVAAVMRMEQVSENSTPNMPSTEEVNALTGADEEKTTSPPKAQDHNATGNAANTAQHRSVKPVVPNREKVLPGASREPEPAADLRQGTNENTASGAAVVDEIIAEITQQVQAEVRSTPKAPVAPANVKDPGKGNEVQDPEAQHGTIAEPPAQKPFMPNTFTPNNDGLNDDYRVSMVGYTSLLLRVYSLKDNRLVFSANNGEPWTGENCEDGMYLVAVEAMTATGQMVSEGKVVWLNRNGMN